MFNLIFTILFLPFYFYNFIFRNIGSTSGPSSGSGSGPLSNSNLKLDGLDELDFALGLGSAGRPNLTAAGSGNKVSN